MKVKIKRNLISILSALMFIALVSFFGMPLPAKAETTVHTAHTGKDTDGSKHKGWTPIGTAEDLYNLVKTGGKGYLTNNIAIERMRISGNKEVNLCLNGYSLEGGLDGNIRTIELIEGAELNLFDESKNTGEITNCNEDSDLIHLEEDSEFTMNGGTVGNSNGRGVEIYGGSFTLNDGNVSGNSGYSACGVVIEEGIFTMNGGNISNNTTYGGVYVDGGTFTMNGGAITDNAANNGGGVYVTIGTFIMNGGAITDNAAVDNGGGVWVYDGTFTINAGSIENNTAKNCGGGVGVSGNGICKTYAGSIGNNTAEYNGGGVYVSGDGIFTTYAGSIGNNTANYGGGVYVDDGTFTISGGEVAENKSYCGGGVYVFSGNIIMNEGAIKNNSSQRDAGGVYVDDGTFIMNGGAITDNAAVDNGGGVYGSNLGILTINAGQISDNIATCNGGGVDAEAGITMNGGKISGNKAEIGGGIFGSIAMKGGTISDNTAEHIGGGLYIFADFSIEGGTIENNKAPTGDGLYVESEGSITGGTITDKIEKGYDCYSITYDPNKGTGNTSIQFYDNLKEEKVSLLKNKFTRNGFSFDDWNTKEDGSGTSYDKEAGRDTGDIVLYAQWIPKSFTVKFNANGGSGTMTSQTRKKNDNKELPENTFSYAGYIFKGWNTKADGSGTFYSDKTNENIEILNKKTITLYAQWEAKTDTPYKVEHYKQKLDGTYNKKASETESLTGTTGTSVTPEVKTYKGFSSPVTKSVKIKGNGTTVVKYYYERNSYTLTWDFAGGSVEETAEGTYTTGSVKYGDAITAPVVTKKGYTFNKWSVSVPSTMPAKNLTIKAVWKANYSTVTLNVNGGTALEVTTVKVQEFTAYGELPKPARAGYSFDGWYTAKSGGTKVTADTICEGNITLYAHWKANSNTKYTVEHYKQKVDGTYNTKASETEALTGKTNASVTPEVKTYKGFTAPDVQTAKIKADGTLVIKYYYKRNSYKLTWDFAGGKASGTYTKGTVKYGAKITAPVPVKDGYVFNGWDKTVPAKMPANDATYKAKWRKLTNEEQVRNFVSRFYTIILDRPAEESGLNDWTNKLITKKAAGADVAAGFINSSEFQKKKMTDEEYVTKLYRAFFDREPDKAGYDGWLKELKNGKSRDYVLRGFINSPEFNNLCKKYGINAGSY